MNPKFSSGSLGEIIRTRLSQQEYIAKDLNANLPITRRCAYPLTAPAIAGQCTCWKCHNDRGRAKFSMLRTGPAPLIVTRHRKYLIK